MNIWRNNAFSFLFFDKQTKQCLEIGILQYIRNTVVFLFILSFYFIFVLIFSNHKLLNLLIVIDLFVRVFMFCKYALLVFLSKIQVPFYSAPFFFTIFCSFLLNLYQKYLSVKYVSKLVWICTAYTLLKC